LTERPIGEVCPIEPARMENRTVLQWDKDDCAWMGLVKFDLLGLGMLGCLQHTFDLAERHLKNLDYAIASLHPSCIPFMNEADTTSAVINAMKNPYVQIIGHPDDSRFPLNYDEVVCAAAEHHILLEINNASLTPNCFRVGARENYLRMLEYCKKYRCHVLLSSDAHADTLVGNHSYAAAVLTECNFPEELVVNTSPDKFISFLN